MISQEYLLLGLAVVSVYCLLKKEKYEIFGFSGNLPKPDLSAIEIDQQYDMSKMKEVSVSVTPDMMQNIIFAVIDHIKSTTNLCVYAINVPFIRILGDGEGNSGFKARIMFTTTRGFPMGFEVDTTVVNDQVVFLSSQPRNVPEPVKPYTDDVGHVFLPFDQLESIVKPKPDQLPDVINIADHERKDNHYIY